MYTLANRQAIAATDGAPVLGTAIAVPRIPMMAVATIMVSSTGSPASQKVAAAIEVTQDGTNWYQVVRFTDITADGGQVARAASNTTVGDATLAAANLGSAAASPTVVDTPWAHQGIRATTQLQTLTGGAAPTITVVILLSIT